MPLHLQSITKEADNSELFAWLVQNGMDMADTIFISSDGRFILIQTNIIDTISDSVIGKLVYTLEKSDELKQLNILDLDIVINSSNYCEVEFIRKLEGSSVANEYYEVETVAEGQHLEIETVNRHTVSDDLEEKTMQLRFSAFPFQLSVFHDIEAFNKWAGFADPVKVGSTEWKVAGYSSTFSSPAGTFEDGEDEHYSFMLGTVISFKDVRVIFGKFVLDFIIADVETALGIIPVAMSRDIFDLTELKNGCIISMKADIKADMSNDADFRSTKK